MKRLAAIMIAGWVGWVSTTRWEEASFRGEDEDPSVQRSKPAPTSNSEERGERPRLAQREPLKALAGPRGKIEAGSPGKYPMNIEKEN